MTRWLLLLTVIPVLSACDTLSYYTQAVRGQAAILLAREPIRNLLDDADIDARLRQQLLLVDAARDFAEQQLALSADGSFTTYVDPGRQFMVWNVFAAPWNAVDLRSWCFPVAGCVTYRGYFSEQAARKFASRLQAQGYDVFVGGVDAYSTLGWFADPLPAPLLRRTDEQLVGLIFHELSHQRLYLPGDTRFNESFATFVEQQGIRQWHQHQGSVQAHDGMSTALEARKRFTDFVLMYRERFRQLYAAGHSDADELAQLKQQLFEQMRSDWMSTADAASYAGWFAGELNNARLATVGAYFDWVPAFEQLYENSGSNFARFYTAAEALSKLPAPERLAEIERLQTLRQQRLEESSGVMEGGLSLVQ